MSRSPGEITVPDVLITVEKILLENMETTIEKEAPYVEMALKKVFKPLDHAIEECLLTLRYRGWRIIQKNST